MINQNKKEYYEIRMQFLKKDPILNKGLGYRLYKELLQLKKKNNIIKI